MTSPRKTQIAIPPRLKLPIGSFSAPANSAEADIAFVEKIAQLLDQAGVAEIEVERAGLKVRVSRNGGTHAPVHYQPGPTMAAPPPSGATNATLPPARAQTLEAAPADLSKHPGAVASPMVGTAYLAPQPGAQAFVQVGDIVKEDQTLLIVEAMKTMNPIPAPKAGKITQILVQDGRPVEYGEILMVIE